MNNFANIVTQQRQRPNSAQVTQAKNQIITSTQQALNAYQIIEKGIENLKTQLTFKQLGLDSLNEQTMQEFPTWFVLAKLNANPHNYS